MVIHDGDGGVGRSWPLAVWFSRRETAISPAGSGGRSDCGLHSGDTNAQRVRQRKAAKLAAESNDFLPDEAYPAQDNLMFFCTFLPSGSILNL